MNVLQPINNTSYPSSESPLFRRGLGGGFYQETTFRDRPSTFGKDGKRVWLFPKMPKGKLYNIRRIIAWTLLAFFYLVPFLKINGEPLILLNILQRKFILFGSTFYPQDFHLLVIAIITLIVFIVLFTVIYGRIFCGWVCPQTVFLEFLYRPIEYLIDGNAEQQKELAEQEPDALKILKRILKHGIYLLISLFLMHPALNFIFYDFNLYQLCHRDCLAWCNNR